MTKEELQQSGDAWKQVHLSTVILKRYTMESFNVPGYDLKGEKVELA